MGLLFVKVRNGYEKTENQLTLIEQKGTKGCHRGHKIGDTFDFDNERGKLCPMAMHVAFPYIDILRYGGKIPARADGSVVFCCPDADVTMYSGSHIENDEA